MSHSISATLVASLEIVASGCVSGQSVDSLPTEGHVSMVLGASLVIEGAEPRIQIEGIDLSEPRAPRRFPVQTELYAWLYDEPLEKIGAHLGSIDVHEGPCPLPEPASPLVWGEGSWVPDKLGSSLLATVQTPELYAGCCAKDPCRACSLFDFDAFDLGVRAATRLIAPLPSGRFLVVAEDSSLHVMAESSLEHTGSLGPWSLTAAAVRGDEAFLGATMGAVTQILRIDSSRVASESLRGSSLDGLAEPLLTHPSTTAIDAIAVSAAESTLEVFVAREGRAFVLQGGELVALPAPSVVRAAVEQHEVWWSMAWMGPGRAVLVQNGAVYDDLPYVTTNPDRPRIRLPWLNNNGARGLRRARRLDDGRFLLLARQAERAIVFGQHEGDRFARDIDESAIQHHSFHEIESFADGLLIFGEDGVTQKLPTDVPTCPRIPITLSSEIAFTGSHWTQVARSDDVFLLGGEAPDEDHQALVVRARPRTP
ncbi:MAG: hypothetical protein HY791_31535 [Deltaproteobacteria bacterium]|nr:hypothetical protein [Deltaproteobacteria bacterium]